MTPRGPNPGALHALPKGGRRLASPDLAQTREPPEAPKGLGQEGTDARSIVMANAPLLLPALDALTVARLADLVDERGSARAELDRRGILLEEPIVSPTGKVVGTRVVPNPAVAMLRQLDRELDALADRLGLVPAARARLGLTLTTLDLRLAVSIPRTASSLAAGSRSSTRRHPR